MSAPRSSAAALGAGGCPGKEREKGKRHLERPGACSQFLGESISSAVAVVPPALCSLSLGIFIKFMGMLLSETPALCPTSCSE